MRHFLTSFLAFHWAVAFALLAMACISDGDSGAAGALNLVGVTLPGLSGPPAAFTAFLALAFAVASVLFFWTLLTSFFGDGETGDDLVIRMAFGTAACVLSLVLAIGATQAASGLFFVISAHLAALLTSYLAIQAERWSGSLAEIPDEDDIRAAARVMAAGAAHSSMLSRLSGRPDLSPDGGR